MTSARMEGVFPILVTPFDEKGRIDEDSLARLIEFNLAAAEENIHRVRPGMAVMKVSAKTGYGMEDWLEFVEVSGRATRDTAFTSFR